MDSTSCDSISMGTSKRTEITGVSIALSSRVVCVCARATSSFEMLRTEHEAGSMAQRLIVKDWRRELSKIEKDGGSESRIGVLEKLGPHSTSKRCRVNHMLHRQVVASKCFEPVNG